MAFAGQRCAADPPRKLHLLGLHRETRPMDEGLRAQMESYLTRLDDLIHRGRQIRDALATNPSDGSAIAANRMWQEDCGVTINQLSRGSKAHWLARSFSEAFLMRSASGHAATGAAAQEIAQRLLDVLERAVASLHSIGEGPVISSLSGPLPRRFEFVHNPELRPVVEQAYTESRRAFAEGDYNLAMRTSCGILEAIVTDALEHKGLTTLAFSGAPAGEIGSWSFETRLAVAEKAELIHGGCARLPAAARRYRDPGQSDTGVAVSERDAQLAGQVLHVVMRDLNPGR